MISAGIQSRIGTHFERSRHEPLDRGYYRLFSAMVVDSVYRVRWMMQRDVCVERIEWRTISEQLKKEKKE